MPSQVAVTADLVHVRSILRHRNSNTTQQPSEPLSFLSMVPASSFKDISKVPLMADF